VYFDGNLVLSWNKDITQIVGSSAYFGFTGGTGSYTNLQYVKPIYVESGDNVLNLEEISSNPIIDNLGDNTYIGNIEFENLSVGILANETGLNNLTVKNCGIYGRLLDSGVKLIDYDWSLQSFPSLIHNLTINASGDYGILMLNKVWANISSLKISLKNGIGVYWANWAGGFGNITVYNSTITSCDQGLVLYKNGNGMKLLNSTVENSIYEGIYAENSTFGIINSSLINNSIGLYANTSNLLINNSFIFKNRYEGLSLLNSSSLIFNANLTKNSIGIYLKENNISSIQKSSISYNNYGIEIVNSSNVNINRSKIFNSSVDGIALFNGDNVSVENSMLWNNNYSVLSYGNLSDLVIVNSVLNSSINSSIRIDIPSGRFLDNLKLYNVSILNSGSYGLFIDSLGNASNISIYNSLINSSYRDGIFIYGVNSINIINNSITYNGLIGGDPAGSGIKISGNYTGGVLISQNNISYNLGNGISLEGLWSKILKDILVNNNFISNNGIQNNSGNGIYIGGRVENLSIVNNTIQYSNAQGILIQEANGWNAWDWIGTNISVINNTIQYNGLTVPTGSITAGITVGAYGGYNQDNGSILIEENKIVDNNICPNQNYGGKVGGIEIYGLNESWINLNFTISKNIIANNSAYGISVGASKDIRIINNTIFNNEKGVVIPNWDFVPYNIIISKNSIYNNSLLGIDLDDDNITPNDGVLNYNEANYGIDYPIITSANLLGDSLTVSGYIGNGTGSGNFANAVVEIYLVRNSSGGDNLVGNNISSNGVVLNNSYGEGWIYLGSLIANANGFFSGTINVSGKGVGNNCLLTATATMPGIGTSEFGRDYLLIRTFYNITATTSMLSDKYVITVHSQNTTKDVYVYWIKPNDVGILNISGDFDENGSNGNTYWFKFNTLYPNDTKVIIIDTNITTIEGLNVGVDPLRDNKT